MIDEYIIEADLNRIPSLTADVMVIGSGVAGLSAALAAAKTSKVTLACKAEASESNTFYAQGGVAVALASGDTAAKHRTDTIEVSAGLASPPAVEKLVTEGIERVRELVDSGAKFDREGKDLAFGMEGGHSRPRIIHAAGDATGREVEGALLKRVRENEQITILEHHFAVDLLHYNGTVYGAIFFDQKNKDFLRIRSAATVLATGGAGQIYRETTNPEVATGDGVALALRAGAEISDMEFVQFHPTTLYMAGVRRFLISEAVRGEGARIVDADGRSFIKRYDKRGDLAPRDVVSRAIVSELARSGEAQAWLDMSRIPKEKLERRFPQILAVCGDYGLDARKQPIPVRPSAHYFMGGIKTNLACRTNLNRLFACGEAACSGVHGANRLASNSILEGLVFGHQAGLSAAAQTQAKPERFPLRVLKRAGGRKTIPLDIEDVIRSLKSLMWRAAGVMREGGDMAAALEQLRFWQEYVYREEFHSTRGYELMNMLLVSELVMRSAIAREESRGAHFRTDHPHRNDRKFKRSLVISRANIAQIGPASVKPRKSRRG